MLEGGYIKKKKGFILRNLTEQRLRGVSQLYSQGTGKHPTKFILETKL